jgi:starch synthase
MNIMKAGLQFSHRIVAVSEGYAWECQTQEGGWGLDQIIRENTWKLRGIVNGIDYQEWSPMSDPHLLTDGYTQYDMETMVEGKRQCKVGMRAARGGACAGFCFGARGGGAWGREATTVG